ncbi:MAG: DUF3874 domain-containing protein [Tannerella sp.]|nr:DUF3874 domain-containing protein [Tannerella sp.]
MQKANHLRIPPTRARSFGRLLRKYGFQSKHTHRGTEFFMVAA